MASLKKAIDAHCKNCTYDPLAGGTWREQVESCRVTACALWEVRPRSTATVTAFRRAKTEQSLDMQSIVDGLEDEDEDELAA
jgi:hypothetical protein